MKYAYFPGCKIPGYLPEYGHSVQSLCHRLDIQLVPLEFACCGWPIRQENELASVYSAIRNVALAARAGLDILTPCKCCFGNLRHAMVRIDRDTHLATAVEALLHNERLAIPRDTRVRHLLAVLDREVGASRIAAMVRHPLTDMRIACHYGCHALRPGNVTEFDDPLAPTIFERILSATGAQTVEWELRLECCGYPLRGRDDSLADALLRRKRENAHVAGATVLATACTYCHMQFAQHRPGTADLASPPAPAMPQAVLFTHLLETALG